MGLQARVLGFHRRSHLDRQHRERQERRQQIQRALHCRGTGSNIQNQLVIRKAAVHGQQQRAELLEKEVIDLDL